MSSTGRILYVGIVKYIILLRKIKNGQARRKE